MTRCGFFVAATKLKKKKRMTLEALHTSGKLCTLQNLTPFRNLNKDKKKGNGFREMLRVGVRDSVSLFFNRDRLICAEKHSLLALFTAVHVVP